MTEQDHLNDWRELCKAAVNEPDPEKLMNLISEINRLLDERERKQKSISDNAKDCVRRSLRTLAAT